MNKENGLRAKNVGLSLIVVISMLISGIAIFAAPVTIAQDTMGGEYGGDLRTALQGQPSSLNPLASSLNEPANQVIDLLYESLGRIDPYTMELVPWMASSWEVDADDESIVSIVLMDGISWHDGTEVTLEDVEYSFGADGYDLDYLSAMTLDSDTNTITFDLVEPDARFFSQAMEMKIVQNGFTSDSDPMGCGPFMLESTDDDSTIVVAFDDHFIARPFLDSIIFTYYAYSTEDFSVDYPYGESFAVDEDPRWAGSYRAAHDLIRGDLDFIGWGLSTNETTGIVEVNGNETTLVLNTNTSVTGSNGFDSWYMGFNNAPGHILNDVAVRKAIAYAINKQALTQYDISGGLKQTESVVSKFNVPWYNSSIEPYSFDMTTAHSILDNAGYMDYDSDGWRDMPDGTPFNFTLLGPPQADVTPYTMSTNLITWFEQLGLNVSLVSNTSEVHQVSILADDYDIYLADSKGDIDPQFLYELFHSEATTTNLLNFAGEAFIENETQIEKIDTQGMVYKGEWDANSNTPTLNETADGSGWYYACSVAGTHDFGNGSISFDVGDWVVHNGTYLKVVDHIWSFMLNYTNIIAPVYVYHNDTLLANDTWELNYNTGELTMKEYPLNFENDTINITYNYVPFDHYMELAGSQMEPDDRAAYIKDAQYVMADLCPSVPMFTYMVNHAYFTGSYIGWVQTLGGLENYWTYTNLKNELVGDLEISISSFKQSLSQGEITDLFVKVQDKDGANIPGATLILDGEGTFGEPEYDGIGQQFTVEYTAPEIEVSKTITLGVTAYVAGYSSDSDQMGITVHPPVSNFIVDIVRGNTSLESGESTDISVVIIDKDTSAAISGATVVLSLSPIGLGGELSEITGTTNSAGEFLTSFSSNNVTVDTTFRITAYITMEGYVDSEQSTSISVARDPMIEMPGDDKGFLGLPAPSFLVVLVLLATMSMVYAAYRRKD